MTCDVVTSALFVGNPHGLATGTLSVAHMNHMGLSFGPAASATHPRARAPGGQRQNGLKS